MVNVVGYKDRDYCTINILYIYMYVGMITKIPSEYEIYLLSLYIYSWVRPPFTVESDYDPVRNELNFPTAMLHLPFYTADGPQ